LDIQTAQELYTFNPRDVNSLAFSPDGRYLLAGSGDSSVSMWDIRTKEIVQSVIHDSHSTAMEMGVTFSLDGKFFVTSGQDAFTWRVGCSTRPRSRTIFIWGR